MAPRAFNDWRFVLLVLIGSLGIFPDLECDHLGLGGAHHVYRKWDRLSLVLDHFGSLGRELNVSLICHSLCWG